MLKGLITPTRCLIVLVVASCFLFFLIVPHYELLDEDSERSIFVRQLPPLIPTGSTATDTQSTNTDTSTAKATTPGTSTTSSSTATTSTTPTSTSTTPNTSSSSTATTSTTPTSTSSSPSSTPSTPTSQHTTSQPTSAFTTPVVSTQSDGQVVTEVITTTPSSAPAPTSSQSEDSDDNDSSGSNTKSTIIGLSVAGGVALIGIVAFFVWKFTRKRFSDDFDDGEAIKWPELNNHEATHALPTNSTGRAGFETGSPSELSRAPSRINDGYATSVAASSTAELYSSQDPYAVPPLPHLNPSQPYRDDPGAYGAGYYDPYRGPVPQTFNDTASEHVGPGGEAIPMTQLTPNNRARSPAPGLAYDMTGRASPQPPLMGRPGPQAAMGRMSPGPQAAYGYPDARGPSPGPNVGLGLGPAGAGRRSPGPQAAYDAGYGPR